MYDVLIDGVKIGSVDSKLDVTELMKKFNIHSEKVICKGCTFYEFACNIAERAVRGSTLTQKIIGGLKMKRFYGFESGEYVACTDSCKKFVEQYLDVGIELYLDSANRIWAGAEYLGDVERIF